jgi:hypothetical protein
MSAFSGEKSKTKGLKEVRENLDRLLRSRWQAEAKVLAGEGDALGHGGQSLGVLFHEFAPVHEAGGRPENNFVPRHGWKAETYLDLN